MSSITMAADSTQRDLTSKLRDYGDKKSKKKRKRRSYSSSSSSSSSSQDYRYREHKSKMKHKSNKNKIKSQSKAYSKSRTKTKKDIRSSDSDCPSDLDLEKVLFPMEGYVVDKEVLLAQMLRSISTHKLKEMLPEILKPLSMAEIKSMCLNQLEGMSRKRIEHILDGRISEEISSSDEASNIDEDLDVEMGQKGEMGIHEKNEGIDGRVDEGKRDAVADKMCVDKKCDKDNENITEDNGVNIIKKKNDGNIREKKNDSYNDKVKTITNNNISHFENSIKDNNNIITNKDGIEINKNEEKKIEIGLKDEEKDKIKNINVDRTIEKEVFDKTNNENKNCDNNKDNINNNDMKKNAFDDKDENEGDNNDNTIDSCYEIQCYAPEIIIDNAFEEDDDEGSGNDDGNNDIRQVISDTNQNNDTKIDTEVEASKPDEGGLEDGGGEVAVESYNDKTQLEILELEMRARAIKAMLRAQEEVEKKGGDGGGGDVVLLRKNQGVTINPNATKMAVINTLKTRGVLSRNNATKRSDVIVYRNKQLVNVRNNTQYDQDTNNKKTTVNIGQTRNQPDSHLVMNVSNNQIKEGNKVPNKEFKHSSRTVFIPTEEIRGVTTRVVNSSFGNPLLPKSPTIRRIIKYERPYHNNRFFRNNSDDDDDDDDNDDGVTVE